MSTPAREVKPLLAEATWRGGYAAEVDVRGHRITVDEPVADGGGDSGPMPTELLCASLASCLCLALSHVAAKHEVPLADLRVSVAAQRDGRALRYGHFAVTVRTSLPEAVLAPLLARAERYCWVSNTLATRPTIDYSIESSTDTTEVQ